MEVYPGISGEKPKHLHAQDSPSQKLSPGLYGIRAAVEKLWVKLYKIIVFIGQNSNILSISRDSTSYV